MPQDKKKVNGNSSSKALKPKKEKSKIKRKPSNKEAIQKAKTIEVLLYEDLKNFQPRTSFERIQCAVNPSHKITADDLTEVELTTLYQYHYIYQQLILKDVNQQKLSDVIPGILEHLELTKGQFWLRLANTKKLFAYEGNIDQRLKKAAHREQVKALYEELLYEFRTEGTGKMAGTLVSLLKYIGELEIGGSNEEARIEQVIEDLQFPQIILEAPDEEFLLNENIEDAEFTEE